MKERVSDEVVAAVIQRAIELQRETDRVEADRAAAGCADSGADHELSALVRAAGEVGIGADEVNLAAAEVAPHAEELGSWRRKIARAMKHLGAAEERIELRIPVASPPTRVAEAVREVCEQPSFCLEFQGLHGTDILEDGVLEYKFSGGALNIFANPSSTFAAANGMYADLKQFLIAVRPDPAGGGSILRVVAPLGYSLRVNHLASRGIMGAVCLLAALPLGMLAKELGLGLYSIAAGLAAGICCAGAAKLLIRRIYPWAVRKGRQTLLQLANAISTRSRSEEIWRPRA